MAAAAAGVVVVVVAAVVVGCRWRLAEFCCQSTRAKKEHACERWQLTEPRSRGTKAEDELPTWRLC